MLKPRWRTFLYYKSISCPDAFGLLREFFEICITNIYVRTEDILARVIR